MTFAPQSSPLRGLLPAFLALASLAPRESPVASLESVLGVPQQRSTIKTETPFFGQPNGPQLGALQAGAVVVLRRASTGWQQVTFEGWIFTASTGPSARPEFSLAINAPDGENLRAAPDGDVIAHAIRGTGLTRLSKRGGWTQVRRSAWIKSPESRVASREAASAPSAPPPPPPAPPSTVAAPQTARPVPSPGAQQVQEPAGAGEGVIVRKGANLATGPGGATIGSAPEGLRGEVMERSGNWVRVRTDAWVRAEDILPVPPDSTRVTLEALRADPEKYVGQPVTWRLQFLAVQTADELRPELPPGLPYLLTRGPLPDAGFVYVTVTAEQAARFRAMNPLDEFVAHGTLRASKTKYLPTPVIDLIR